jgi:signal transduction histidine kinase
MIRILHIEDDPLDAELVARELARSGLEVTIRISSDRAGVIAGLAEFRPDVILSDFTMGGFSGEDALDLARTLAPDTPFIFMSGGIGEDRASQLLKNGARDYVLKDRPNRLPAAIVRALEETRAAAQAREMENHLRRAQKMEAVGSLAAGVAHEINNPLTYVLSNLESLRDELGHSGSSSAERRDQVAAAIEGVLRIREIVRNLKTFARSDENDPPRPVDLVRAAENALAMAMPQVRHRTRVERALARVPPAMGHEGRIGQVILNLIVNACQAMGDDDSKQNVVIVRTLHDSAECVIEVEDNGPGIAVENLERIFDPYFTTKPAGVGTGLGLAICRSIVEGHGGRIEVKSASGRGATFRVRLPAAPEEAAPRGAERAPRARTCRKLRILIVDDEPSIRRSTCRVLGHVGHTAVAAASGAEALRILADDSAFDLILSDLHMADISGQGLHERLMKSHPRLAARMVFMTGGAVLSGPRNFLDGVPNPRIEKPFQIEDLMDVIESAVGGETNREVEA